MKVFAPEHIKYLYDLAREIGQITIEPDFTLGLEINPTGNGRGEGVHVSYDGAPIARYPFTPQGIAQGLSRLRLAERQSHESIQQMIKNCRGY